MARTKQFSLFAKKIPLLNFKFKKNDRIFIKKYLG